MSLITRCPACGTMFKVVPDQLRLSAGWVRCGVCAEVFDASVQMLLASESNGLEPAAITSDFAESAAGPLASSSTLPEQGATSEALLEAPPPDHVPELVEQTEAPPSIDEAGDEASSEAEAVEVAEAAPEVTAPVAHASARKPLEQSPPSASALYARRADPSEGDAAPAPMASGKNLSAAANDPRRSTDDGLAKTFASPEPSKSVESESDSWLDAIAEDASAEDEVLEPPEEVPSFVRQAQRRAFWSSRGVRSGVWLVAVLVVLGLAWQWAVSQRDWLAAHEPRLAPVLELLCRPSGCAIAPYRDLKVIVIDGSSFQRVSENSFQLSFGLRNNGDIPVATPSLELTLTDAQNQALMRRVLRVQELSAPPALAARGEFNGVSALNVDVPDPTAIVGYRLVAFYP